MSSDSLPYLDLDNEPSMRPTTSSRAITPVESRAIRSELAELGSLLDLPSRTPTRARSAPSIEAPAIRAVVPAWRKPVAIAIMVVSALVAVVAKLPSKMPPLPEDLLGEWRTTLPDYEDQLLGFSPTEVVIRLGPDQPATRYPISSLKLTGPADSLAVSLTYKADGGDIEMHALLLLRGVPRLVFAQPAGLVWEREVSTASSE